MVLKKELNLYLKTIKRLKKLLVKKNYTLWILKQELHSHYKNLFFLSKNISKKVKKQEIFKNR